jgi:hypothetical protein
MLSNMTPSAQAMSSRPWRWGALALAAALCYRWDIRRG